MLLEAASRHAHYEPSAQERPDNLKEEDHVPASRVCSFRLWQEHGCNAGRGSDHKEGREGSDCMRAPGGLTFICLCFCLCLCFLALALSLAMAFAFALSLSLPLTLSLPLSYSGCTLPDTGCSIRRQTRQPQIRFSELSPRAPTMRRSIRQDKTMRKNQGDTAPRQHNTNTLVRQNNA